jgi:diguanylate cyclase (GGDEF)-like protein/PAS domain S-box-containing protein
VNVPTRLTAALRRRSVVLALALVPCAALLVVYMQGQRRWQEQAQALYRENLALELKQLGGEIERERAGLSGAARLLAQSEGLAEWVEDGTKDKDPPKLAAGTVRAALASKDGPAFDPKSAAQFDLDEFFLIGPAQAIRFSGARVGGQIIERSPDPAALRYTDAALAAGAPKAEAAFAGDQLLAIVPIMARGASAPTGWVVATRNFSRTILPRLQNSLGGALVGWPVSKLSGEGVPADVRDWAASSLGNALGVSTHIGADLSGYAALTDSSGRAVWVLRVRATAAAGAELGTVPLDRPTSGPSLTFEVFLALLAAVVAACVIFALRRYFRHRQSIDSRYKAIIDQTNDGIVIVDSASYKVQYCNPAFLAKIDYTGAEAAGLTLTDLFADGDAAPESVLSRLKGADSQLALNLQLRCKTGALIDMEVRCNRLETDEGEGLAYVTHDVSVRRKAEQQLIDNQQRLDRMAHHDQLTGLPNRHYLATFLPQAIAEVRAANQMLGVVFLDLDRFKHINDTRGHEVGDKLLQEVARRLKACVRESDVVIRMGGDEFVVVFRNVRSYDEVTLGAARINDCLNKPIIIDQHPLQTTGSVGVSLFPRDGADMGELLKHSDTAMYQAKDRGRNNVQMFSQIMNRKLKQRVAMEASLREALRLKQLDVHYQPFVNLQTRKVVGLEALIRWRHPVHGMVPADQFIPVAEETGLIVPMGNFVLHRTLQTMSAWQKQGVKLVPVSLNVAPAQLQRGELQSTISTLLATHELRPELLQLEMTERGLFDSSQAKAGESRQDTMVRLRDLGIKIAIDDFGTGYSSLSYLKNWRVDALKIDRSFVRDLVTDSSDLAIVSAIIAIARHLRIQVIAEGIEGYQQAEILRKLGCTIGQGFLFARPMPADQCLAMLGKDAQQGIVEEEDMLAVFASGRA